MHVEPLAEHRWLERLVGAWAYESEATMAPGEPPQTFTGTEVVRSLGGVWILCEGEMPGETPGEVIGRTIMTLGYDPVRERFVGTFIGSMMTHLWVYEGTLDAAGRVLSLDAEGPNFAVEGEMAMYRDVIEILDPDHRTLSSGILAEDGTWQRFMTAHYRRVAV